MTAGLATVPASAPQQAAGPASPREPDRALLETLRACARAAQRGPRFDLDRPCPLAAAGPGSAVAHGVALMRALDGAAVRPLPFHPRGATAVAFGEAWALRLVEALRDGDAASAQFLIGRAVRRERRRLVWWLATRMADALATGNSDPSSLESFQAGEPAHSQPAIRAARKERS